MNKRRTLSFAIFTFLATFLCLLSCRKEFLSDKNHDGNIAEKFFAHSVKTDKLILRVIEEIKTRNAGSGFVSEFAVRNGFPVWDKPIISYSVNKSAVSKLARSNSEEPVTDTFAYIPIVPENSDRVNGFILAKISNGVELLYSLAQDYKAFSFDNGGNLNDATQFVITNLLLNKEVFGVADYTITDYQLFTGDPEHDRANQLSIEGRLAAGECAIISWESWHCGTPDDVACQNGCDHCGGLCYPITSSIEICTAPNTVNWPAGGIGINPSGGGSGGGGGGEIPHYYPCISSPAPLLPGDPTPTCPAPGPGSGWETHTFNPNNPCDVLDSLLKTTNFKNHLKMLRDSTVLNYEKGVSFTNGLNPANYTSQTYSGTPDSSNVNIVLTQPADGIMHSHDNRPNRLHNFSAEDIYKLAYYWSIGQVSSFQTFTYTVVTDSTAYILMVTNPAQFINFAQTWFNTAEHFEAFKTHMYRNHHYGDAGNSILQDEINFLSALQAPPINGGGFKLFRGNSDMTIFTPIKLNSNGQIRPDPCN